MQRRRAHFTPVIPCLVLGLAALLAGCRRAEAPTEPPPVCSLRLPEHLQHTEPDALTPEVWYSLMFKGYAKGQTLQDPVDCLGEIIRWDELPESCKDPEPTAAAIPSAPLKDDTLVIRNASGGYWFGWAPFRKFENGLGEGPLAIARLKDGRLEFRAVGTLRAYTVRPRLEVRRIGGAHLLVAEGENCKPDSKEPCMRATRLMWLDRQRFRARPLRSATVRTCLGPAWFPLVDEVVHGIDEHWQRTLRRDLSLAFEEGFISIDENIAVFDRDLKQQGLPPRVFREAQSKLKITIVDGEFRTEGQSIWSAIRIEDAATERDTAPSLAQPSGR